jgi:hypothetical protein
MPTFTFSLSTILGAAGTIFGGLQYFFPNNPYVGAVGAGLAAILMKEQAPMPSAVPPPAPKLS